MIPVMSFKLRDYQVTLKANIYKAWNEGAKTVLAVMPTGSGKTVTFSSIALEMALDPSGPRFPTVICVHRKELVEQISLTLARAGVVHNLIVPQPVIRGIIAAQRREYKKQFYDYKAPVTVISVDTLNSRFEKHQEWAKTIKFWIVDEAAHVLKANKWGKALQFFPNAIGLGVTATPQRLDKRGLGSHADGLFEVMVQGPTSKWMIDKGHLCKYFVVVPKSDYREHLKEASEGSDYSTKAMSEATLKSHIVGDIVENYKKFAAGKQAIVFTDSITSGSKIEAEFLKHNISAKLLTGNTPDEERRKALLDYRDKKIRVLLNVDLFDEGLDVPGIEVVIFGRPTKSLTKFLQSCGRGLRPAPGKDRLILIDHVGNIKEHGLPDARRKWTLDRIIRRRDKTNLIRICKNWDCNAVFDRVLTECPYCGYKDAPTKSEGGGRLSLAQVDGDLMLLDPDTIREMEAETVLDDPAIVAQRVSMVAGTAAGLGAMAKQRERIETQKKLVETIALWAGKLRSHGYSDRSIHKYFYMKFEKTITQALSEPRVDMVETTNELQGDVE